MNDEKVIVSIMILAYNHEPYIRKALDSIVMQQTDFKFEAIVGEDMSTDGTRTIIKEYIFSLLCENQKYNINIILFL